MRRWDPHHPGAKTCSPARPLVRSAGIGWPDGTLELCAHSGRACRAGRELWKLCGRELAGQPGSCAGCASFRSAGIDSTRARNPLAHSYGMPDNFRAQLCAR